MFKQQPLVLCQYECDILVCKRYFCAQAFRAVNNFVLTDSI